MTSPIDLVTAALEKDRPAFMPYFSLGYPDYETSLDIVQACAEAGADIMELGIPFSDPLADGPTIQHSTQTALQNGMTVMRCLEAIVDLRQRGLTLPLILMGYYNPILNHGEARFINDAALAGANGFIIPDLPPEEAAGFDIVCCKHGLGIYYLLAPNSTEDRIRKVAKSASGFTYLVSLTGVTGARGTLPPELETFVARVRRYISTPLAVGFGISTADQVQEVARIAQGVIVGSKLITIARDADDPVTACGAFVREMMESTQDLGKNPASTPRPDSF